MKLPTKKKKRKVRNKKFKLKKKNGFVISVQKEMLDISIHGH